MRYLLNLGFCVCVIATISLNYKPLLADQSTKTRQKKTSESDPKASQNGKPKAASEKGKAATKETQEKADAKKVRLAHIVIQGQLPESAGQMSLFGDLGLDLRKTISRIDNVAHDHSVEGLILDIQPIVLGRGKLNELSAAIGRVRAAGKKVYAQVESAMGAQYLLASACDEVVMPESGIIVITGVHAQFAYLKDLLSKLGIEADFIHMGAYKGAAEPLTRSSMSKPVRKNMTALIDDIYDQMITTIASNRQLKVEEVKAAIDTGLLTAQQAVNANLIDRVVYPDVFRDQLADEYETDKLVYVLNYKKKKVDTDFSGPMGMVKLFQTILGTASRGSREKGPQIAIVYAVGPIMTGKSQNDAFGGQSIGSTTIVKALQEAAQDDQVQAIVLRVDSPGGSALASDLIWRTTQKIEKPIVASMGDVAASGGYYISMGADKIVAEPGTVTGSIGVVGGKITIGGLQDKIGIATEVISRGKNSGIFSGTAKFSDSEREVLNHMMQDIYKQFTSKAAAGRDLPVERLEELAGGQVYSGRDAKRIGLIDDLGTLKDAVNVAKRLAGIEADKKVGLKILPKPENPFEELFGVSRDEEREATFALRTLQRLLPEFRLPLQQATQLRRIMREPVMLLMPFSIEIK